MRATTSAARELSKFCWLAGAGAGVERTARELREMTAEGESIDWWELSAIGERPPPSRAGSPLAPKTRPENPPSP